MEHLDLSKASNAKIVEKKSSEDKSEEHCYMVQGNDSLEANLETQLDDGASSFGDDFVDADALNEELSLVCENLLEKYQLLKKKSFKLKEEIKICFLNLTWLCKKKLKFLMKGTH